MILHSKIPISYVWRTIRKDMLIIFIFVVLIAVLANYSTGFLPDLVVAIPALLGTAISILLSFRVSQSYDRWWEARKIWSQITNDSRTFALQITTFLPKDQEQLIKKIAYRHMAWPHVLGRSLRKEEPRKDLEKYLEPGDLDAVNRHANAPLGIIQLNMNDIQELRESGVLQMYERVQIDSTMARLVASMGSTERIKKTVFPVTYALFLKYMLYIFLISLAISLKEVNMLYEIPLLMVVACAFFLLEASAHQLQDPFEGRPTDTSMTLIAETIEADIRQILGEADITPPKTSETFYQL